jgi:hypothetical protein
MDKDMLAEMLLGWLLASSFGAKVRDMIDWREMFSWSVVLLRVCVIGWGGMGGCPPAVHHDGKSVAQMVWEREGLKERGTLIDVSWCGKIVARNNGRKRRP